MPQSSTRLKQNQAANQAAPAQAGETGAAQSARQPASRPAGSSATQPAGPSAGSSSPQTASQPTRPSVSQLSRPSVTKRGAGKPTKARKPLNVPSVQPGGDGNAPASASGESAAPAEQASTAEGKGAALKRRLKRFSVAKAEKTASDQAKQMEGAVSEADAEQAKDAARVAIAGEAAKRRLERRQRMLKRTGEGEVADAAGQGVAEGDVAQGGEAGEGSQAGETARKLPFNLSELHLTWPVVAVLVAIAVVVVTVGSFSWGRWLRYDDAADFQGAWYANGTTSLVTVDGQEIHLTSDVAYGYTLDTGAKTITFTFGDLQGQGLPLLRRPQRAGHHRRRRVLVLGKPVQRYRLAVRPAHHRVAGQGSPARGGRRRRDGARSHAGRRSRGGAGKLGSGPGRRRVLRGRRVGRR